ncbi:MAG: aminotransferase class III-fold pyridoxal phosphate-dependent enzyme [Streptococcus sp.]
MQEDVADLYQDRDYLAFSVTVVQRPMSAYQNRPKGMGKQEIITFQNSFHGRTFGSMSATGQINQTRLW